MKKTKTGNLFSLLALCLTLSLLLLPDSVIANPTQQILVISDIHFNPLTACEHKPKPCKLLSELREADTSDWDTVFKRYSPTESLRYKKDSSIVLLNAFLKNIHSLRPDTVLVLGDYLAHDFYRQYRRYSLETNIKHYNEFVRKTMQYLSGKLRAAIQHETPIYAVIGNNDAYANLHCKDPDYCVIPAGEFYRDTTQQWKQFISDGNTKAFSLSFPNAGYYAAELPNHPDIKVIALNTVLFSTKAQGNNIAESAQRELEWLAQQFAAAKKNKTKIILTMHIPIGIDVYKTVKNPFHPIIAFWRVSYAKQFLKLLDHYSEQIIALFGAHIHKDGFMLIHPSKGKSLVNIITPSISPIYENNPGYQLVTLDPKRKQIINYTTFYLPIRDTKPKWKIAYHFNATYQPDCKQQCNVIDGMRRLQPHSDLATQYVKNFTVGTVSQPIHHGKWLPYYWCSIHNVMPDAYKHCLHSTH